MIPSPLSLSLFPSLFSLSHSIYFNTTTQQNPIGLPPTLILSALSKNHVTLSPKRRRVPPPAAVSERPHSNSTLPSPPPLPFGGRRAWRVSNLHRPHASFALLWRGARRAGIAVVPLRPSPPSALVRHTTQHHRAFGVIVSRTTRHTWRERGSFVKINSTGSRLAFDAFALPAARLQLFESGQR